MGKVLQILFSDTGIEAAEFERRLPEMVGQALRDSCTPTNPRAPDANTLTQQAGAALARRGGWQIQ
jgi:alcohol dehydrogenase class IV